MSATLILATLVAQATAAPPPDASSALQTMIASPRFQAYVGQLFARLPPEMFLRCDTLVSKGSRVVVAAPVAVDGNGHPIAGSWKQSFPVSGCGNDTTINFFFTAHADGNIEAVLGVPGETRGSPQLQKDATGYVLLAAHARVASCATPQVIDSIDDGPPAPMPAAGDAARPIRAPWHETWTVATCGSRLKVGVRFVPDATGTGIFTEVPRSAG